jgi:hypothetical protein
VGDPTQQEVGTALAEARQPLTSVGIMGEDQFNGVWRMSKALAASRMFKDVTAAEQAFGRILIGADLGMTPAQSLMGIDIVKGNPQVRGVALGRMVRQYKDPDTGVKPFDYRTIGRDFTPDNESATVALYRRDDDGSWPIAQEDETFPTVVGDVVIRKGKRLPWAVEAFKLDQAKKRKLIKIDGAWDQQPEVMVVWRALSQLVRFECPEVIGGISVYTEADGIQRTPNLSEGVGSGEGPGWGEMPADLIERVGDVIQDAGILNFAPLADEAVVQQRLFGQSRERVERFLEQAHAQLESMAKPAEPEPEDATVVDDGPLTLTFGGGTFTFVDDDASLRDAIRSALDSGDNEALIELARKLDAPDNAAPYKAMAVAMVREAVGQTGGEG